MGSVEVASHASPRGWTCIVAVRNGGETRHLVHVSRADLARLAPGATDPGDLVRASFAFLLEREPREAILREFEISVIGRYFPEFEREIKAPRRARASSVTHSGC